MANLNSCGVYCLVNKVSSKVYIGSGTNVRNRLMGHFWELRRGVHKNRHLQASFNKYGEDSFSWFVLEMCDLSIKYEREQFWIDEFDAVRSGYNIRPRADYKTVNEDTKKRISAALKARKSRMPEYVKAALVEANKRRKGEPRSSEWRAKTSATLTGRTRPEFSPEWKRNMARPSRFRPVECYTLDGALVGKFEKMKDAAIALTKGRYTGICLAINGKAKTAYGYIWKPINQEK